jgi:murein DD-endopeptidase MepM/ murein hydrolase activator NlpD
VQRYLKKICLFTLAVATVLILGWLTTNSPTSKAATADTYQYPCYPYSNPNYYFGQYISGWGYHVGEDVCHSEGTPVYAVAGGIVRYSNRTPDSYRWGNLIIIEHYNQDGSIAVSLYGHLRDDRQVPAGAAVGKGQLIGFVGPEGPQNGYWGPHTHFGIHPGPYGYGNGIYAPWVHGYENPCCGGWVAGGTYVGQRLTAYDWVPLNIFGGPTLYYNSTVDITFQVRNTGAFIWRKDGNGSNPVRLGTTQPRDRASPLAGNASQGWAGANRIKLEADTSAGEIATFKATFVSNQTPGTYKECFTPVVEGVAWMPERTLCTYIVLEPPGWRGQWYNQMITTNSDPFSLAGQTNADYLLPGDKRNFKLFVKNVGELDWNAGGANPTRLGDTNPHDRVSGVATIGDGTIPASENWVSTSRPSGVDGRYDPGSNTIVADSVITTGEIGVFSFTITAPDSPGNWREYFSPVVEGQKWMPEIGAWFPLSILDRGYHFQYVSQTLSPSTVGSGTNTQAATLRIRNTGRESWPVGGAFRLGTENPRDHASGSYTASGTGSWISPNRLSAIDTNVTSPGKTTVDPGETAEFSMTLTDPLLQPGTYKLFVQPVMEGVNWLPEQYGIYFPITITAPPYQHQVMKQTFSGNTNNFHQNSTMTAKLAIKNTGRLTWPGTGANQVRLGTERPKDHASGFTDFTASDPWLSASRASGIDGRVTDLNTMAFTADSAIEPGETAMFQVPLKANLPPGSYNQYFNLVHEGINWFNDIGIFFPLTVTP